MALDPHRVLQVDPDASMAEITRAYRKQAKRFHPDLQPTEAARRAATENMTRVNQAYESLKRSHRYDRPTGGRRRYGGAGRRHEDDGGAARRARARAAFRQARDAEPDATLFLDRWWDLPRFVILIEVTAVILSIAFGHWPKWIVWTMMMLPAQISTLLLLLHLAPTARAPRRNRRGSVWQPVIWGTACVTIGLWHWTLLLLPFWIMLSRYLDHVGL